MLLILFQVGELVLLDVMQNVVIIIVVIDVVVGHFILAQFGLIAKGKKFTIDCILKKLEAMLLVFFISLFHLLSLKQILLFYPYQNTYIAPIFHQNKYFLIFVLQLYTAHIMHCFYHH